MKQYIGVDVGKRELDIFDGKSHFKCENSAQGISALVKKIKSNYPAGTVVVFEATGGYEQLLSESLSTANIAFKRAHPNKIRHYGKALGLLAKTDRIDAKLIWKYASEQELEEVNHLLDEETANLKALLGRREQLIDEKVREFNRLDKHANPIITESIRKHIDWIDEQLEDLEKKIKQHVKANENLITKVALYKSIKGFGEITAAYLTSYVPELGDIDHNKLAALVGLAPMNCDSGKKTGKRSIQAGRANVRKVLYMAALSAIRFNKGIRIFYQRLINKGKPFKVAITAVMRKLIIIANSVATRGTKWEENAIRG
jgi:transposase